MSKTDQHISRRDFIKLAGTIVIGLGAPAGFPIQVGADDSVILRGTTWKELGYPVD